MSLRYIVSAIEAKAATLALFKLNP